MRIKCYCNMYVSTSLERKRNKVISKLMERRLAPSVYILTLAQGEQNHLEFFPAILLRQHVYDNDEIFVVGLAESYESAVELVERILRQVLADTGGTDIRRFILEKQLLFEESRG